MTAITVNLEDMLVLLAMMFGLGAVVAELIHLLHRLKTEVSKRRQSGLK